jgi:hypothetical protein
MKHVVRKVISTDRRETLGYGVFMAWNVAGVPESGSISIVHCSDPSDNRPLHEQPGKAYKMKGLHKTPETAKSQALQLSVQKVQPR